MKPLVYWCRWQTASLRLRGRDKTAVWGEIVYPAPTDSEEEISVTFRFDLKRSELTLEKESGSEKLLLDEMGVVR